MPSIRLSLPDTVRVIEQMDNGGIIEIPIAKADHVDLSQTSIGSGILDINVAMFEEMVTNFKKKPGATNVYLDQPHNDVDPSRGPSRDADERAAGSYLGLTVEGDQLWARMNIGPDAWQAVVIDKGITSFSMEADLDPSFPTTGTIQGWVLTGGIFTNHGALDVHFIAACEANQHHHAIRLTMPTMRKETEMPRSIEDLDKAVGVIETKLDALPNTIAESVTAAVKAAIPSKKEPPKPDETSVALEESQKNAVALEAKLLNRDITDVIKTAIADGVEPKYFPDWEKDPVAFLTARFGGSLDGLTATVKSLPRTSFGRNGVGGGGTPEVTEGEEMEYGKIRQQGPIAELHGLAMKMATADKISYKDAMEKLKFAEPEKYKVAMSAYKSTSGSAQ